MTEELRRGFGLLSVPNTVPVIGLICNMKNSERILVVDDNRAIRYLITSALNARGFVAFSAASGGEAMALIRERCPDIIILDLDLPDMDGLNILRDVRQWSTTPVIVVSARTSEADKVLALDMGADDFMEKPFSTGELLARVRTAIRHTRTTLENKEISQRGRFTAGNLIVDYSNHTVTISGNSVNLTPHEYRIIALLAKHSGRILTYDFMVHEIWGPNTNNGKQILRAHMSNIRRKIEANPAMPEYIFTEINVGYRMREPNM